MKIHIDGMNLFFRYWSSVPDHAVISYIRGLNKYGHDFNCSDITVYWEGIQSRFPRRSIYPYYKSNRDHSNIPDKFLRTMRSIKDVLGTTRINQVELDLREADDMIAYVCQTFTGQHRIISTDKDYVQLVNDRICVVRSYRGEYTLWDRARTITELQGCLPENYVYLKAINGDNSDNIPGVPIPRTGEKTILKDLPDLTELPLSLNEFYQIILKSSKYQNHLEVISRNYQIMCLKNVVLFGEECKVFNEQITRDISSITPMKFSLTLGRVSPGSSSPVGFTERFCNG